MKNLETAYAVIIPALDPPESLLALVKDLRTAADPLVVVVNDGSSPEYAAVFEDLQKAGAAVLHHQRNYGKGRALKTAFAHLLQNYPELRGAVVADADGQHAVGDMIRCLNMLAEYPHDLIIGCRELAAEHVPWKSKLGNRVCCKLFSLLYGIKLQDTQCGLRGIPADFMSVLLELPGERYEFESFMLREAARGLPGGGRLRSMPIQTLYGKGNRSSHLRIFRDSAEIIAAILQKYK